MTEHSFGPREFRDALSEFATGVTVVTTKHPAGGHTGLTVNSFSAVSLDPPLVLWCLSRGASCMPAFESSGHFAVNVLAADQLALSRHFATSRDDKLENVPFVEGLGGAPLLSGCVARFQCRTRQRCEGGDHVILVGEVIEFDREERPALLFHKGVYAVSEPHPDEEDEGPIR